MTDTTLPQGKDLAARVSTTPPGWPNYPMKVIVTEPPPEPVGPAEPTTPNETALQSICNRITAIDRETLALYNSYKAMAYLHSMYAEAAVSQALRQASQASSQLGHQATANKIVHDLARGHGAELTTLAQIESAMRALQCDGRLAPALEMLDALHVERARLEAAVQADNQDRADAHQAVIDAQAAAIERARLAAEGDPDLKAARARLAAFDPAPVAAAAPLTRGKIKLAADPLEGDLH